MREWWVAGALVLAGVTSLAHASDLLDAIGPTVSLRGAYWSEDKSHTGDEHFPVGSAWLTLSPKEFEGFRTYFDGYAQIEDAGRHPRTTYEAREAYVERAIGALDLRAGRQVIVWGRADKLNPTDSFAVRDFRLLMTNDDDQRLGTLALQAALNVDSFRFVAIWAPEWRFPGLPIPPLGTGISLANLDPAATLRQFGLKLDQSGGAVDWSISWYHGIGRLPDLRVLSLSSGISLGLSYPRVQVLGGDFATSFDGWGLRGETAYTWVSGSHAGDPLTQNGSLFTVIGVERTLVQDLGLNLQYLNRYVAGFEDPSTVSDASLRRLSIVQSVNAQQQVRFNHGISLRPNYKMMNETLELEIAWARWWTTRDQLVRPKVTYALSDHWKAIVGGEIYTGPEESLFGRLRDSSALFIETRLGF